MATISPQRPPTIGRIAEEAGVSRATVSRALSRPEMLLPGTVERIRAVAQRLGYVANDTARALKTGRHRNIGLIVPDIANPFFPPLIRAVQARADAAGFSVFLGDSNETPARELALATKFSRQVDGFVLASSRLTNQAIAKLASAGPMVLINREVAGLSHVLIDVGPGMARAVEHLAGLGHRHVVYVSGPPASWSDRQRRRSLAKEAKRRGLRVSIVPAAHPSVDGGRGAAGAVLATGASAAIAFGDFVAHGLLAGIAARGLSVPADFSIIGCDDVLGACTFPALTSIAASCATAGHQAMDILLDAMSDIPGPPARHVVGSDLVVRATTGEPGPSRSELTLRR